jgi:hypothetical protein
MPRKSAAARPSRDRTVPGRDYTHVFLVDQPDTKVSSRLTLNYSSGAVERAIIDDDDF